MATKQELELTWIGKENPPRREPRIRVEFGDPQGTDSLIHCQEATLAICHEPRCGCSNIRFEWLPVPANDPAAAAPPAREFWFNLNERAILLTPELEKDPESLRLAEVIRAELTEADEQRLREWFLAGKLALIQTTPASEIDITNLPNAEDGKMIGFVDVFPCGLALNFTWNNEAWAVDEQYCVQPGCKCKETVLSFLKLMDAAGQKATLIQDTPSLLYNYHTLASKPVARGPAGSPALDGLLAALKRAHADLNPQLEFRHLIMQTLYTRHCLARAQTRRQSQSADPRPAGSPKIGRKEPCPCGSGRKYKHCCMNKPRA
jgi:SEC-C motif